MVTVLDTATSEVVMLKAGEINWPAATVTEAGTEAVAGSLLVKFTVIPPGGGCPASVTVFPVAVTVPTTEVEVTLTADSAPEFTESVPCLVIPL